MEVLEQKVIGLLEERENERFKNNEAPRILIEEEKKEEKVAKYENLFDLSNPFSSNFTIHKNIVTYNGDSDKTTHILLNHVISKKQNFKFQCKILKMMKNEIYVGVADKSKVHGSRFSSSSGNAVCYISSGKVFFGIGGKFKYKENAGAGFKEG